jgi:hypothetical protein
MSAHVKMWFIEVVLSAIECSKKCRSPLCCGCRDAGVLPNMDLKRVLTPNGERCILY